MHRTVLVRGTILEKTENSLIVRFEGSNVFWDETDIGFLGREIELQGAIGNQFQVGQTIIARGGIERQGLLQISHFQSNTYQPLGVDWKITLLIISVFGLTFFIISLAKLFYRQKSAWKKRRRVK